MHSARRPVSAQNPYSLVDALDSLVAKSLVSLDERGTTSRWRLLEMIREYAREKLVLSGEFDPVAQRHAEHSRDLLERTEAEWETRSSAELSGEYAWRIDNLRAALDRAFCENGDASLGIALAAAAVPLWLHFLCSTSVAGAPGALLLLLLRQARTIPVAR
jgi:predicted ATPase